MRIDFDYHLVDADGKYVEEQGAVVTIRTVLKRAILADATPDGRPVPIDEKVARFDLFLKLKSAEKDTDFSLDEVALLDKAVLVFPTLIAGQLHYLLHQKTV